MKYRLLVIYAAALLLSGCSRYICWIKENFSQADHVTISLENARLYLKSTQVYDTFVTVALIDVLWLSPEVRKTYVTLYGLRWSLSDREREALIESHEQETENTLAFYVLLAPDEENNTISLTNRLAEWSVLLSIDGNDYIPREIKRVDLDPEYLRIFGKSYSHFKGVYLVLFDLYDEQEQKILTDDSRQMSLIFRTTKYQAALDWCLSKGEAYEYSACCRD